MAQEYRYDNEQKREENYDNNKYAGMSNQQDNKQGQDKKAKVHMYDDEYGDCYRVYCAFECKDCRTSWMSDNAWVCYDKHDNEVKRHATQLS